MKCKMDEWEPHLLQKFFSIFYVKIMDCTWFKSLDKQTTYLLTEKLDIQPSNSSSFKFT